MHPNQLRQTKMGRTLLEVRKIIGEVYYCCIRHEIVFSSNAKGSETKYSIWDSEKSIWSHGATIDEAFAKFKESRGLSSE